MSTLKQAEKKHFPIGRSAARLAAVQALYQMEMAQTDVVEVLKQFSARATGTEFENGDCGNADFGFFREIVEGVVREQRLIDPEIGRCLAPDWPMDRLDAIMRAILRASVFELMFRPDIPPRAAINEYMDVARAFYEADEPRFVNGVLDRLARTLAEPRL